MVNIYNFNDYKSYVRALIQTMPKRGHGQYQKIAKELRIHTSFLSQIFNGSKNLNPEQAYDVAEYFGLSESETDFFLLLVALERAGTEKYKNIIRKKIKKSQHESLQLSKQLDV